MLEGGSLKRTGDEGRRKLLNCLLVQSRMASMLVALRSDVELLGVAERHCEMMEKKSPLSNPFVIGYACY